MSSKKKSKSKTRRRVEPRLIDSFRQRFYPPEFRITLPATSVGGDDWLEKLLEAPVAAEPSPRPRAPQPSLIDPADFCHLVAELSTSLWYLKTKHFRQVWGGEQTLDDDPRQRLALRQLDKAIGRLQKSGVEIQDPTNQRYPQGGENMMKPIQFIPTPGITRETVTETVVPIVYYRGQLIQRGEVFVAIPEDVGSADDVTKRQTQHEQDGSAEGGALHSDNSESNPANPEEPLASAD